MSKRRRKKESFTTIKALQANRRKRVQFSLSFSDGKAPSGFIVFDYINGNRALLEPYIIRLTHFFCGEWEAKPLLLPAVLSYHVGRVGKAGERCALTNINTLLAFVRRGQKGGVETMAALPVLQKNAKAVCGPRDLPEGFLAFLQSMVADEDLPSLKDLPAAQVDVRLTMPDLEFAGFVAWEGIHGNASPWAPPGLRKGRYAEVYILDVVRAASLREHPEAAADLAAKTAGWLDGTAPFAAHGGANHKTDAHRAWLKAHAPEGKEAPDLPDMMAEEASFFYKDGALDSIPEQDPILPPHFLERVKTHGWATIAPDDLQGVDKAAWLAAVTAARQECREHFAWVVYRRHGIAPPTDMYGPLWGYKEAERLTGNPYIMNAGHVKMAQGNSLCSGFAGLGAATANSRGPAVIRMQTAQCIVRRVATVFNGRCFLMPDRYRVKRFDGPENIFTLHWDTLT